MSSPSLAVPQGQPGMDLERHGTHQLLVSWAWGLPDGTAPSLWSGIHPSPQHLPTNTARQEEETETKPVKPNSKLDV